MTIQEIDAEIERLQSLNAEDRARIEAIDELSEMTGGNRD